jgi:hypothetical protein
MLGAAMDPRPASPYDAFGLDQTPPGAFDPAYFSDGELGADEFPGRHPDQIMPSFYGRRPLAGGDAEPAIDREAAIQHAAAAVQRGTDPVAVRARRREMGHADLDPPGPFSDMIPEGPQKRRLMNRLGAEPASRPQPALQDQAGPSASLYSAAYARDRAGSLQRRADPRMAP